MEVAREGEMPSLTHLRLADYADVYEPSDDTYLFVDTLHRDAATLNERAPALCLEVGGGTGAVSMALARLLQRPAAMFVTDVNPVAAATCARTARHNGVCADAVVHTDLVSGLLPRLEGKVDVMLFNPPYVVTPPDEIHSSLIARSWAGGNDGREVLDRLLPDVGRLLSPGGLLYLIAIEENKPEEICARLLAQGLRAATVYTRRQAKNESLMIIKAQK